MCVCVHSDAINIDICLATFSNTGKLAVYLGWYFEVVETSFMIMWYSWKIETEIFITKNIFIDWSIESVLSNKITVYWNKYDSKINADRKDDSWNSYFRNSVWRCNKKRDNNLNNSRTVPEGIYIGVLRKWY